MVASYLSHNIKGSIGISTAKSSNETAWGYANFANDSGVHNFGSNTVSDAVVSFKCFHDKTPRDYCEVAIVKDRYPTITSVEEISIFIDDLIISFPHKRNYNYNLSDGKDHNVVFFAISSEDGNIDYNIFQYMKNNVGTTSDFHISW